MCRISMSFIEKTFGLWKITGNLHIPSITYCLNESKFLIKFRFFLEWENNQLCTGVFIRSNQKSENFMQFWWFLVKFGSLRRWTGSNEFRRQNLSEEIRKSTEQDGEVNRLRIIGKFTIFTEDFRSFWVWYQEIRLKKLFSKLSFKNTFQKTAT